MPPRCKLKATYSEEQLENMSREDMINEMTDKEISFCEFYINDYNPYTAAVKAGYSPHSKGIGLKIRRKEKVMNYIAWLKLNLYHKANLDATDILNSYAKMAFYDIKDYVEKVGNRIKIKDLELLDGQIIQEISQNTNGITIKFPDRIKAFEKLENYMDINPYDWKRKIEEQKLELMKEKLEVEKSKYGLNEEVQDDGFIEALENASKNIWEDESE